MSPRLGRTSAFQKMTRSRSTGTNIWATPRSGLWGCSLGSSSLRSPPTCSIMFLARRTTLNGTHIISLTRLASSESHFSPRLNLGQTTSIVSDILLNGPPDCILILIEYLANAVYFKPEQRNAVIASNIGILAMIYASKVAISTYGTWAYMKYYFIPWLLVNHWFTMITYVSNSEFLSECICLTRTCMKLHHTDAELPHYRSSQWNFQRGAAATVDRDFLGWQGRFFLHDGTSRFFPLGTGSLFIYS